jgi:tocopherol O-methyltransferase
LTASLKKLAWCALLIILLALSGTVSTGYRSERRLVMVDGADPLSPEASQSHHNDEVVSYYRDTWIDYFLVWMNSDNLALHFGYQDRKGVPHSASLSNANKALADAIDIKSGERVLDAGCGLGGSSFWLATYRGAITTGIALGLNQVLSARREAERRHLTGLTSFLVADFERLPFSDGFFDVVWAQESLCHSSAKSDFFKEAHRVLRRGGRIVVSDFFLRLQSISPASEAIVREWLDGWKIPFLWTAAQHSNAAKSAGFSNVLIKDVTRCTLYSHRRLYNLAILAHPVAVVLERIGIRNGLQHGNVIAALRQYQALRFDCWFYAILSAQK